MQGITFVGSLLLAGASGATPSAGCKCFPGDACWPSETDWASLNKTVGGRLVATVPLGQPCHDPTYDEELCANLRERWLDADLQ